MLMATLALISFSALFGRLRSRTCELRRFEPTVHAPVARPWLGVREGVYVEAARPAGWIQSNEERRPRASKDACCAEA